MKKLFTLWIFLSIGCSMFSQTPQKMNYQCIVRNASGALITNQSVGVRLSIVQGSETGTVVYQETYNPNPQTNANGLMTFVIGNGNAVIGTLSEIDWKLIPYFIRTEIDPQGGTNYTINGTSPLLSVPFALRSRSSDDSFSGDYNDLTNKPALFDGTWESLSGKPSLSSVATSGNYDDLLEKPSLFDGTWGSLTGKPVFANVATSGDYGDLFNKPYLAPVASTGSYSDLTDKPYINNSQWTTSVGGIYYNSGSVGIGVTLPIDKLELYGASPVYLRFLNSGSGLGENDGFIIGTSTQGNAAWIWNRELGNMHFGTNNIQRMTIRSDGPVEIQNSLNLNTAVPDGRALYVHGDEALWYNGTYFSWGYDASYNYFATGLTIGNPGDPGSYRLYVQGNAYATGTWTASDARYKKSISSLENSLEKVMKLRGTSFEFRNNDYKDYNFAEGKQFGFIAQEVEKEYPELVNTDSNGYKSLNYSGMIPVLLEAIKEQQKLIQNLEEKNRNLLSAQQALSERLSNLEKLMNLKSGR